MDRSRRYRNFMLKTNNELPVELTDKSRTVAKYEKDGVSFYHVGMFDSYTEDHMFKQSRLQAKGVTLGDIKEYTHIKDLVFGLEKVKRHVSNCRADHEKKLKRGKLLYEVLQTDDCSVDMLPVTDQNCLSLYSNYLRTTNENVGNIILKPWQQTIIRELNNPTERQVIWVFGKRGSEGKTWMQIYLEKVFGPHRVHLGTLTNKADNMCYALSRESLVFKDIFLFNIARSDAHMCTKSDAYAVMEGIKDGYYFSSKYVSTRIQFKTPNTVIVFANTPPDQERLSKDRWIIYEITKELHLVQK